MELISESEEMTVQKKVLFVNLRLTSGGSEKVMAMLASYYAEHGVDTQMILLNDQERTYAVSEKVKIIGCYCPMKGNKIVWHLKRLLSLRRAIQRSGADTVISFMWDINLKVILAALGLGKKIIISERADPNRVSRKKNLAFAQKWIFPLADVAVFQTRQAMEAYPAKVQKKGVVIPNPVSAVPTANSQKEQCIVAAGRLFEQKNFEMLIRAFAIFAREFPAYQLKIFGEGKLRGKLEKLAQDLGVEGQVFLPGFVENINEEMSKAAIYASSSNYEGISNAMLEAVSMGIPSVCTDCPVGGAAMVIEDHINGILVKVGDHEAMARAFAEIAGDERFAEKLSKEAVKTGEKFSISSIAEMWMKL